MKYLKYLAILMFLFQYSNFATTYYVDKDNKLGNGSNNSWPGTIDQPKSDVNATWFETGLEPGDTVIILQAAGYGRMLLRAASTGSALNPIVIKSYSATDTIKFNSTYTGGSEAIRILEGVHYIHFEGPITCDGKAVPVVIDKLNQGIKITGMDITDCDRGIQLGGGIDCEFKDMRITDVVEIGAQLRGSTGAASGSACQNILFENVHVKNIDDGKAGPGSSDADGFHTYFGENIRYIDCSVENSAEDGFDLNANAIMINCTTKDIDGAGVKVWRRQYDNYAEKTVTMINCVIAKSGYYAPDPSDGNPGIKVSEGAGLNLYNSVVYGGYDQGVQGRFSTGDAVYQNGWDYLPIKVYNTIIAHTLNGPGINDMNNLVTADYNLYYDNYQDVDGFTMGSNSIAGQNPLFTDSTNYDYSIQSGSFAVNEGTDLTSDSLYNVYGQTDFDGVSRPSGTAVDIGAYECVGCSSGTPPDPPAAPSGLSATATSVSTIDLTWTDNSSDEGQFKIERSLTGTSGWSQIGTTVANDVTFTDTGLDCATAYYYRVRASNFGGDSGYSNTDNATTNDCPTPVPSPWTSQDVGTPLTGNASYESGTGTFTLEGDGTDIYGTADHFHYVHQTLNGDGEIKARVTSLENTNDWAKAGVMIRETLTSGSKNFAMVMTAANGTSAQWRTATDGTTDNVYSIDSFTPPYWVRVVRSGSNFTAYNSSDGTSWTQVADTTITMATNVYIGLCVTSHNGTTLCTSVFDNVTVTGGSVTIPNAPSNLSATVTSDSTIDLTWTDNSSDEDNFKIERSPDGSSGWTQIGTNSANDTTYTDSGLSCSTAYYYRVRASNTAGNSSYSNTSNSTTNACPSISVYFVDKNHGSASDSNPGTETLPFLTIQKGVDTAQPGDSVIIKGAIDSSAASTYNVSGNGITTIRSGSSGNNIVITAYSGHTVVIDGDGTGNGIALDHSYLEFHGIAFTDFNKATEGSAVKTDILIENCEFSVTGETGLRLRNIDGLVMRDTYVHHCFEAGISLRGCNNSLLERVVSNYNDDGLGASGDGDGFHTLDGDSIDFIDCTAIGNSEDGFDIASNSTLKNCTSGDHGSSNIKLWRRSGDNYAPKTMKIVNALLYNAGEAGIKVSDGAALQLCNSVIYGSGDEGVAIRGVSISEGPSVVNSILVNNIIVGSGLEGIEVLQSGTNVNEVRCRL